MRFTWLRVVGLCAVLAGSNPLAAGPAKPVPMPSKPQPKLIIALSIDQFSSDVFNEYRLRYRFGLKRLAQGVVFPSGYQSHAATETCPGHATILTGSRPARSGIIANNWIDPNSTRTDKDGKPDYGIYCSEDASAPGSNSSKYIVSSKLLKVPTLGDRMKAIDPKTQVVAVSGKDRGAVMMGGHQADLTLWWESKGFTSYANRDTRFPKAMTAINARAMAAIAKPLPVKLPNDCSALSREVETGPQSSVGQLKPRKAGEPRALRATSLFDALTMDAALAALAERKLGQGATVDVLAISLSATDYIGHSFGTSGAEMCENILALDATIGRLFTALDKSRIPYAIVLTADHGGHDLPERNSENGLPMAQRVDGALAPSKVGAMLAKQFNLAAPAIIGDGAFGDIYLSKAVPPKQRKAVQDAAVAFYRGHPQVAAVFTRDELIAAAAPFGPPEDWPLITRLRASFDPERSGDFLVVLKPYVTPIPTSGAGYVATHGSPWGYDRRVPILFWWNGVTPFEQPNGIETVDILPTIASIIALPIPPSEIDGRCVDVVAGRDSNCP
jgi:predicted AlkP superfamily pyrophosphatase or phosphodiesterase